MLRPGSRVGDTHIVARLGVDHLATYYRCRPAAEALRTPFLTGKLVHGHHTPDPVRLQNTVDDANAVARRPHPNVVQTVGALDHGGQAFILQEDYAGPRLADVVTLAWRHGLGQLGPLCSVFADIARGLQHAHRQPGLVHGDLVLENMLVFPDGVGKLLDVDLAALKSSPGQYLHRGRFEYSSPEAAAGQPIDYLSDIYSLGVALYRASTGVYPFVGDSPGAMLEARLRERPRSPSGIVPDYPPRLEQLVLWMLERDPTARPRSASEVANALAAFARTAPGGGSPSAVRAWLGDLYPRGTDAWTAADPTTTRTPLPQRIDLPTPASVAQLVTRTLFAAGLVLGAGTLTAAGFSCLERDGEPQSERHDMVIVELDRAEVALMNGQLADARSHIAAAERMQSTEPQHIERIERLRDRVREAPP